MYLATSKRSGTALGQNFLVKDQEISVEANEWFVPIEKAYPELEAEYKRLELDQTLDTATRNAALAQIILTWGQEYGHLITLISNPVYMEEIRQKMIQVTNPRINVGSVGNVG